MALPAHYALLKEEDQAIARALNHIECLPSNTEAEKAYIKKFIEHEMLCIENFGYLQANLDKYRGDINCGDASDTSKCSKRLHRHDSKRLGLNLRAAGMEKPAPGWQAHAIIAGAHRESAALRFILSLNKIGFDDPDNGAWLPQYASDRRLAPKELQDAIVHGATHRKSYYKHLGRKYIEPDMEAPAIRRNLKTIRRELQTSTISSAAIPDDARDGKKLERWKK